MSPLEASSAMEFSNSLEDRTAYLAWLSHGAELARTLKGERAKHADVIWCLLTEALDMLDRTPDQEKRWLTSGFRSGGWNMVGLTRAELYELERIRVLSAMKPYDGTTGYSPQRNDLERAMGVLAWLRACNKARQPQRLTKAAIALARGGDIEVVYRLYNPTKKFDRRTVYEVRTRAVGYILSALKAIGIVPGSDLTFEEQHG